MSLSVVYVGLDVHKDSIAIAVAREGREPAAKWKTIPYDGVRLRKALKMLVKEGESLKVCYEAGPTGFGLYRRLREAGIDCIVVDQRQVNIQPFLEHQADDIELDSFTEGRRVSERNAHVGLPIVPR